MIATKKVRDMSPEELKAYRHACYLANPEAARRRADAWRSKYPDRHKAAQRKSNQDYIKSGRAATACKKWRAEHPDYYTPELREADRLRMKAWKAANPNAWRDWCAANPEKLRMQWQRAYAARANAEGSFIFEEFQALGDTCLRCGRDDIPMTIDHVLPVSKGGSNYISNIQPLCRACNSSKRDKHIDYRQLAVAV